MTSPIVPQFIFDMFEREVTKINMMVVHKICQAYNLDQNEVETMLSKDLSINFNIVHEDIEQIKIVKKHQPKYQQVASTSSQSNNENDEGENTHTTSQCEARIFVASDLQVKQCSRPKLEGGQLCKLHQRLKNDGKLKYGTIHEEKPACISTAKLDLKMRRKIY